MLVSDRRIERRFMVVELKGDRAEKNLMAAFAGKLQGRNRYTFMLV
jgi:hypothetical protein